MTVYFLLRLAAVLLAACVVWSMRHELRMTAATRLQWALPPVLAVIVAAVLLYVSPGKRFEFWQLSIVAGFVLGLVVGFIPMVDTDFERKLVRVARPTWDGVGAAGLLFLLALARFVSSDLLGRQSHGFGVLGGASLFLAAFLVGRVITLRYWTARKAIHLDMVAGQKPKTE